MAALSASLVRRLLDALLGATALWSRGEAYDEVLVSSVRAALVLERHRRYVEGIPVYRRLAEEQGTASGADVAAIVDAMMVSADIFKSYEPETLESGDFAAMTDWLAEVSTCRPPAPGAGVRDVGGWREHLGRHGVHVSSSSGTSGRPSFVARDAQTWAALCGNGAYYAGDDDAEQDLLAVLPPGEGTGLQSAALGLARRAGRRHFLGPGSLDAELPAAIAFLSGAAEAGRPVLVFGTPFHVAALCEAMLASEAPGELPRGSRVLTGGGWKGRRPMAREEFATLARRALRVDAGAVEDAYSATELNCVLSACAEGRYHVPPLLEAVLLDDALEWIPEGEAHGLLGFLDPFAASYPGFLVPGDSGHLTREPCPCGRRGWSVRGEITRAPGYEPRGCAGTLEAALG